MAGDPSSTRTEERPARTRRWGTLILLLVSVTVALAVAEFLIRLTMADQVVLFPRHHVVAHYGDFTLRRLRPSATFWHTSADGRWKFTTNSRGFRDTREFSYTKPEGVLRVLSLGDSHTQGFEVRQERTYSAVAERCLRARNIEAEVINTGISGFGTSEQLAFLEQEGYRYQPDVILLGFYANDFGDNVKAGLFGLEDGELVVRKRKHTPGLRVLALHNEVALLRWLSENSYLYSLSLNTVWERAKQLLRLKAVTEYAISTESVADFEEQLATALLERLYHFTQQHGMSLLILDIPQLPKAGRTRRSVPDSMLGDVEASSDHYLDSEEVLRAVADPAVLHVPHGHRHISELTHRLIGAAAAARIAGDRARLGGATGEHVQLPEECRLPSG